MVDASFSIGPEKFQMEKKFIAVIAHYLKIATSNVRTGVLSYSDTATINFKLSAFDNFTKLVDALDNVLYRGKTTRIDLALKLASEEFFSDRGGARSTVPKVAILITDGFQTYTRDARPLSRMSQQLKDKNVHLFVIEVGSENRNMRAIVDKKDNLFEATDMGMDEMKKLLLPLLSSVCKLAGIFNCYNYVVKLKSFCFSF